MEEIFHICPYCREEVESMPPDGVDVCRGCGIIVEGETLHLTEAQWEALD